MRLSLLATITGALLISGCYNQPVISPQRPLRCNPAAEKTECPKGFVCATTGVCAPQSCQQSSDCPAGLACTSRGCVPPPDAGPDSAIQVPNQPDGAVKPSEIDGGAPEVSQSQDVAISILDGGQD